MRLIRIIYRFFRRRYRTCWRKVAHRTKASATREAMRLGSGTHAYRCPYCHRWHVGHSRWK